MAVYAIISREGEILAAFEGRAQSAQMTAAPFGAAVVPADELPVAQVANGSFDEETGEVLAGAAEPVAMAGLNSAFAPQGWANVPRIGGQ